MSRCCVERCPNINEDKIYFSFPASKTLLRKWLDVTPTKEKVTIDSVICHQHFREHEYEFIRGKTRLKAKVIPSVFDLRKSPSPPREPEPEPEPEPATNKDVNNAIDDVPATTVHKNRDNTSGDVEGQNGDIVTRLEPNPSQDNEANKDIEDIITNYQIKQIRPINREVEREGENGENGENGEREESDVVTIEEDAEPVYIEVNVDRGGGGGGGGDCLMVLESVQCEVDPGLFDDHDDRDELDRDSDVVDLGERKEDPISLLTSSDEDEVVIEEPHIDIVEVSDSDRDDDLPLVRLVARHRPRGQWGRYQYYCVECGHTSHDRAAYKKHLDEHTTVLQVCQVCGYTTASKAQYARHKRKHKDEKKYKCHLCEYKARHNMSLIYHLKSHERVIVNGRNEYQCTKCSYSSSVKTSLLRHIRVCGDKRHGGDECDYKADRERDLRKHRARRHKEGCVGN